MPISKRSSFKLTDPCPCGSGRPIRWCCFDGESRLRLPVPSIMTPGNRTNFANPRCFLSITNDCVRSISGEHFISAALLKDAFGDHIWVSGFPWQRSSEKKHLSVKNLTANNLCTRHNSALSPLDAVVAGFFTDLRVVVADICRKTLSRKSMTRVASGEALELWMLKAAFGFTSMNYPDADEAHSSTKPDISPAAIRTLLTGKWEDGCGLYMSYREGDLLDPYDSRLGLRPLFLAGSKQLVAVQFQFCGITFDLIINADGWLHSSYQEISVRRPSGFIFVHGRRENMFALTWPKGHHPAMITIDCGSVRRAKRSRMESGKR